jgi:glucosylceramidase
MDWNLALDPSGGPHWVSNSVDAPIIVNATSDEFYKQPMFYALAHISKFIPPGSQHIEMHSDDNKGLSSAAFLREDGYVAIVLLNRYTLWLLLLLLLIT